MKRLLGIALLVSLLFAFACSSNGQKTEDDYIKDLKYKSRRALALQRLSEMKSKKAIPKIIELIDHRYSTKACVKALGLIGDPVALPKLKEVLDKVKHIDSVELDRLTDEIAVAMGRIGDKKAAPWLIDLLNDPQAGPWGKAGAIKGLAIMGATDAIDPIIDFMLNEKNEITTRYMAIQALFMLAHDADKVSKEVRQKLIKALMVAMFIDDGKLTLFRVAKQVMVLMVGFDDDGNGKSDVIEWLIKTYKNENEDVNAYTDKLANDPEAGFSKFYVQVKAVDSLGFLRNPEPVEFLTDEVLRPDLGFEISAKIAQALERIGSPKMNKKLIKFILNKKNDDVRIRELLIRALANTGDTSLIKKIFPIFEKGNRKLKYFDSTKNKEVVQEVPNECMAAAYTISVLDDGSNLERFRKAVESGKCSGLVDPIRKLDAKDILKQMLEGLELAAACKTDAACYSKKVEEAKPKDGVDEHWGVRIKGVRMIARLKAYDQADTIVDILADMNDSVRPIAVDSLFRLLYNADNKTAAKQIYEKARKFWLSDKDREYTHGAFLQKATEELGYVLQILRQNLGIKEPLYVPFV